VTKDFLQGEKVYNRATMALVHYFLLKDVPFGEVGFLVLSWWFLALLQGIDHCIGTFFLILLPFFSYVHPYCH
jgi:hypothetical protein